MQVVIDALSSLLGWFNTAFLFLIELPYRLVVYVFDLYIWLQMEFLLKTSTYILEGLSNLMRAGGYDVDKPVDQLRRFYQIFNIFFPLDDLIKVALFLFETYLLVRVFGLLWLAGAKFIKVRSPFGGKS